jgi:3-oxoacyl-[acyl-carrier protein] reductase
VVGDVTNRASVELAADKLVGDEPIVGLVNCVGILRDTFLGNVSDEAMDLMFQVNVAGMARVTDVFAPRMVDGSAIVNVGSLTGYFGRFVGASVYGATKAGLDGGQTLPEIQ